MSDDATPKKRGGARKGAGRKPGERNKIKRMPSDVKAAIIAAGDDPVEFMIGLMKCEDLDLSARFAAAKEAAPYIRPRLAHTEEKLTGTVKVDHAMSDNEFARRIALILTGKAGG
jgi:hypothetical protein